MSKNTPYSRKCAVGFLASMTMLGVTACRPSDVLDVPPPTGEFAYSGLQGQTAAEADLAGAEQQLFTTIGQGSYGAAGYDYFAGLLTDEFGWSWKSGYTRGAAVDARITADNPSIGSNERGDGVVISLLQARQSLLSAAGVLRQYEPASGQSAVGEAEALTGYTELLLAEGFCAGVPLDNVAPGGGWTYGQPLSTDSLLGIAMGDFDSALAHANGSDTVIDLASVGLARAQLDRGNYVAADSAAAGVPANFVYNTQLEPTSSDNVGTDNIYDEMSLGGYCGFINISNGEGGNGLPFVAARDPRLALDSALYETCDAMINGLTDSVWYYPLKFGNPTTGLIPLATGIEAQLIVAEAALQANNTSQWLTVLNTLRNSGCRGSADSSCNFGSGQVPAQASGLQPLADPGAAAGRVSLMFSERAFWLFGTGTRLGDMRRLVRQYAQDGFSASTVYPVGTYYRGLVSVLPAYGTDVDFTLPTQKRDIPISNPYYKGCLAPTSQA